MIALSQALVQFLAKSPSFQVAQKGDLVQVLIKIIAKKQGIEAFRKMVQATERRLTSIRVMPSNAVSPSGMEIPSMQINGNI